MATIGMIVFGGSEIQVDDRTLEHLRIVLTGRLRRQECCSLSWIADKSVGVRETIWISPAIPLRFVVASPAVGPINRRWLEVLAAAAGRGDLHVTEEPIEQPAHAEPA